MEYHARVQPPRGPKGNRSTTLDHLRSLIAATEARRTAPKRQAPPPGTAIDVAYKLDLPQSFTSTPIVTVLVRRREPGMRPEPWRQAQVTAKTIPMYPEEADRVVLRELHEATQSTASLTLWAEEGPRSTFALSRSACGTLFPLLGRTGRFHLSTAKGDVPLTFQETPWVFRMRVSVSPGEAGAAPAWEVHGVLIAEGRELPLADVEALLDGGFAIAKGVIGKIDDGGAASWLGMLKTHRRMRITEPRRASFLEEVFASGAPPIDLPAGVSIQEVVAAPIPRLVIHPPGDHPSLPLFAELSFVYDGIVIPAQRPGRMAFDPAREAIVRRDPEAESRARAGMAEAGVSPLPKGLSQPPPLGAHLSIAPGALPLVVDALTKDGFRVEAGSGRAYRTARDFRMKIRSGVDWFEVDGGVEFDGRMVPLPTLLDALRRGAGHVVLDDGTLGVIPEAWLSRHGLVLRLGTASEGRLRFAKSQGTLLGALAEADPRISVDAPLAGIQRALGERAAIVPADPPEGFVGSLRGYQREGLGWLQTLSRSGLGGLLADDMGLGKTVQVLAMLCDRDGAERPSLIVAPRSLVFNWKRESARFTPRLRVLDHTGPERKPPGPHFMDHDLVITTYGTLRRDIEKIRAIRFDHVVLDEAQAIKNDASDTARAARLLSADRRWALSGTPIENHLGELWSIVEFLNPGMLGRSSAWKSAMERQPSAESLALLGKALAPLLLRRTKAQVATDLPARTDETLVCELDAPERALYDDLRDRFRAELLGHVRAEGMKRSGTRVLEALLRLRQAACHPGLLDPDKKSARSAKLDALIPELLSLRENGQKALVFSQFRTLLDIVKPALEAEGLVTTQLDGKTRDREGVVARFQGDPSVNVLLVSLKAGGVGLNLTAAEYVFLLDPWWNPAAEAQAIDRAHRIGQTKPVFAYRLIAKDTVEERIVELSQKKRALAESVIRGDGAPLKELSIEDLELLLR
jgi:superfamily II DNA or RNA helicase